MRDTIGTIVLIGGPLLGVMIPAGRPDAGSTPPTPSTPPEEDDEDPGGPPDPRP